MPTSRKSKTTNKRDAPAESLPPPQGEARSGGGVGVNQTVSPLWRGSHRDSPLPLWGRGEGTHERGFASFMGTGGWGYLRHAQNSCGLTFTYTSSAQVYVKHSPYIPLPNPSPGRIAETTPQAASATRPFPYTPTKNGRKRPLQHPRRCQNRQPGRHQKSVPQTGDEIPPGPQPGQPRRSRSQIQRSQSRLRHPL